MNNVTKFVSRVHETDVTRLSNRHILTTGASKMCKFANAQYHQTICAVKSHSRAFATFQISYPIYVE